MLFMRWTALHTLKNQNNMESHYNIVCNSFNCISLFNSWRALSTWSKPIYILISFIIRHCIMLFTHWRALHTWKNPKEYVKSFAQKCAWRKLIYNEYGKIYAQKCAWRKPIYKEMDSHLYRNVHDEKPFKKNGSHSYINVHDGNHLKQW